MIMLLSCLTFVLFCLLTLSAAMKPVQSGLSQFELTRQAKQGKEATKLTVRREAAAEGIQTILQLDTATMLIVVSLVAVASFGWVIGSLLALVAVLTHRAVAALPFVRQIAQALYGRLEPRLIEAEEKMRPVLKRMRSVSEGTPEHVIYSKSELLHVVRQSKHILSANEIAQIERGLDFPHQRVTDHMTPREAIDIVADTELLGPITLDALYKTGHTRLPVIKENIDHVIGILHIEDLLVATSKETPTAREAMHTPVQYIGHDQTLVQSLSVFLASHQSVAIVVDEQQKTVGLLTLGAVLEALLGFELDEPTRAAES